jgi:hypothetical protein
MLQYLPSVPYAAVCWSHPLHLQSAWLLAVLDCSFGSGRGLDAEEVWSSLFSYTWRPVVGRVSLLMAAYVKVGYEVLTVVIPIWKYSSTPLIRINWDGEPTGYAENPDNWILL